MSRYGFDLHPYLKHSTAEPQEEESSAAEVRVACGVVLNHLHKLDNQQLAALFMAVETEHVNRQAQLVGHQTADVLE